MKNTFYSKGEYLPSLIQKLALGAAIIAGIFAVYLSMSKNQKETIPEIEPSFTQNAQTSEPDRAVEFEAPEKNKMSPIEDNLPEIKKILLTEEQAMEKIPELSSRALIQDWISTEEYFRKTIALIDNIAQYKFPKKDLAHFFLEEKFMVIKEGDKILLDPKGYERFDQITTSIISIDLVLVADIFQALEPKIQSFYNELGHIDKSFRSTLLEAFDNIQSVPLIHDPITLLRPKIVYTFSDPELESLSSLNKQFIRMGPINTLLIQNTLKELSLLIEQIPPAQENH